MKKRTILCIDDSGNLLQVLKMRFEMEVPNVKVITAMDGEAGLELARSAAPDLILLDVVMPGLTGDVVLKQLKSAETGRGEGYDTRGIPVIVYTARGLGKREKFLALGAAEFIESPFDTTNLVSIVRNILPSQPLPLDEETS